MKILVTGGSGFLGTHVRQFFNADDFSRKSNLDILNLQDVQMVEEYDVVIHLAAFLDKSPENADECFLTNVEGTINILRQMRQNSVLIFASTKDVYGRHADNFDEVHERCLTEFCGQSPLEWSKLIAEKYVEFYSAMNHFRSCIFRLSTVYAPSSWGNEPSFVTHYLDSVKNGETIYLPAHGKPKRDLLYVEDFALACRAFIDSEIMFGLYNVGGGYENSITLRDLVKKMEEITGKTANIVETDSNPVPLNYITDISKIEHDLGWKPTVSIDEGLRRIFESA